MKSKTIFEFRGKRFVPYSGKITVKYCRIEFFQANHQRVDSSIGPNQSGIKLFFFYDLKMKESQVAKN